MQQKQRQECNEGLYSEKVFATLFITATKEKKEMT